MDKAIDTRRWNEKYGMEEHYCKFVVKSCRMWVLTVTVR